MIKFAILRQNEHIDDVIKNLDRVPRDIELPCVPPVGTKIVLANDNFGLDLIIDNVVFMQTVPGGEYNPCLLVSIIKT